MSAEDQIRQFAERIVRLEEERKALAADIKEIKSEAKSAGYSPKLIAACVRIMLMEAEKRAEALAGHEELDLYLSAVGLVAGRPDHETRRDAGGSGYAGSAMAARAAARDEAEADVFRETDASVSATNSELGHSGDAVPPSAVASASTPSPGTGQESPGTLSRSRASDLDQSVRGNALCGTPSRAGGEIARHTHSGRS